MAEAAQREGGDITAADMIINEQPSKIVQFYENSTIFLTGATGFLGKVLLEKILRTCQGINKVYILVREKKNVDQQTRFREMFAEPCFDTLKRKFPNFWSKVCMVVGDCVAPDLGLSAEDQAKLIAEVNVIFHCAATVRFDQKLKTAAYINVRATRDLMNIAEKMKNLKAFVHMSTAYSNCGYHSTIKESFYGVLMSSENLLNLIEIVPEDQLIEITPTLIGENPNTYIYTKVIAEDLIRRKGQKLPIGIVRPSIIIASVKEPVSGWIDNFYGPTGIFMGAALGLIRTMHANSKNIADIVPVDYVANCTLAAAWEIGERNSLRGNIEIINRSIDDDVDIPIFNFVSSQEAPQTWKEFSLQVDKVARTVPSSHIVWDAVFFMRVCKYQHMIEHWVLHMLPAYIVDFVLLCLGKERQMVDHYKKIAVFLKVISYFANREWKFYNDNVQKLWLTMTSKDRELFEFSLRNFDWQSYYLTYVRGMRVYLLKDPLETIPQGRVKYYKMKIIHYTLMTVILLIILKIITMLFF